MVDRLIGCFWFQCGQKGDEPNPAVVFHVMQITAMGYSSYEVARQILSTNNITGLVLCGGTCRLGDAEVEKKVVDKEGNGGEQ